MVASAGVLHVADGAMATGSSFTSEWTLGALRERGTDQAMP